MALESGEASRLHLSCDKYRLLWYTFFVLIKRDMKLKIGQKPFHFSFVDLSGFGRGEDRKNISFF